LTVLGDIFDRGDEARKMFSYLSRLPKERRVLVRGKDEYLYLDMPEKKFPARHGFPNGTVSTFF
jgi:hypothetical protein